MADTALTGQALRAQIISDPAQAAQLRELLGAEGVAAAEGRVAVLLLDGDGLDAGRATIEFDNAPSSASVPRPDPRLARAAADRGLMTNRRENMIETTDGYRFEFSDNQVRIDWPGREGGAGETTFVGNRAIEGDGTEWDVPEGNFVLPNGAMFTLDFDDDGKINNFTLVHGDSRVDVGGIGRGDPQIGRIRDGGYDFRMDRVEGNVGGATFRMGGTNDGWSNLDVTWNAEQHGQNFGVIGSNRHGNTLSNPFAGYVVDPELKPEFGTNDYERMIRAEIEDVRSVISGNAQAAGASNAYGDLVADYMLGTSGTYDRYANELTQSRDSRTGGVDARIQQLEEYLTNMFSGMPGVQPNFQQGMAALQQLMQLYAQSQGMQNDYQQASSNLRSYIPSAQRQPQAQDMAQLVDQIVNGVGQERRGGQQRNRLENFDLARGGYQGRSSRGTGDSVARLLEHRMGGGRQISDSARERLVDRLKDKLSTGITDWAVTDGEAHDVIHELSHHGAADLEAIARDLGPEMLSTLHDNLTDEDKATYKTTLERLNVVSNLPTDTSPDTGKIADALRDTLSTGVTDWAVTDANAREAIDRLSRLGADDVAKVIDDLGPDLTSRIVENLSDEDKERYGTTVERLRIAQNFRREETSSPREVVEDLKDKLSTGVTDWAVTDEEARDVIDRMSKLDSRDFAEVAEHLGPEMLSTLEENLTDSDREAFGPTLQRLRAAVNNRGSALTDASGAREKIEDALSYGIADWAVTEGEARTAISELAKYNDEGFRRLVDSSDKDLLARIRDNLSEADTRLYGETLRRLATYAGV